ncbi:MAG: MoaD/ThiS family protein [Planctomycetota bacterium]|jgi:MoaD family protein
MKVKVKTLLPLLAEAMGRQEQEVEFEGTTVGDLLAHLVRRHGPKARQAIFDESGELDPVVSVLLNEEDWVRRDHLADTALHDGDTVALMMLMAGG